MAPASIELEPSLPAILLSWLPAGGGWENMAVSRFALTHARAHTLVFFNVKVYWIGNIQKD